MTHSPGSQIISDRSHHSGMSFSQKALHNTTSSTEVLSLWLIAPYSTGQIAEQIVLLHKG